MTDRSSEHRTRTGSVNKGADASHGDNLNDTEPPLSDSTDCAGEPEPEISSRPRHPARQNAQAADSRAEPVPTTTAEASGAPGSLAGEANIPAWGPLPAGSFPFQQAYGYNNGHGNFQDRMQGQDVRTTGVRAPQGAGVTSSLEGADPDAQWLYADHGFTDNFDTTAKLLTLVYIYFINGVSRWLSTSYFSNYSKTE
ncbi:hypothetical protein FE257_002827 [Aspergillus nanangensis]|uniref:Uncharacterized protein n=1 Tax=Aspergillus nanangensis TaxID=2582783 RepID=A0AAD4CC81_ASPNN|nr:hypothetical protein FE257_002827 [Aspergillus nanangensis]